MEPQAPQAPAPQDQPVMTPPVPEQLVAVAQAPQMEAQPMTPTAAPMTASPAPMSAQGGTNPGHGMGIAGLVCAFLAPLVGLILSIVAMKKSKKAGMGNGIALAGIIIGSINVVLGTLFLIGFVSGFASVVQKCNDLGPGTHYDNGTTIT